MISLKSQEKTIILIYFFTNEILFEKWVDFKYVGFDIWSNITFPREYKQEFDKHFYPSFSNNEAFWGIYEILEKIMIW